MTPFGHIPDNLTSFSPLFLKDLDRVSFMDRVDTKYLFFVEIIPEILEKMKDDYMILETGNSRSPQYLTRYYDTPDYLFFTQHVRNQPDRFKLRFRRYESTDTTFLEIKKKNAKNRTKKWRIKNDFTEGSGFNYEAQSFISNHIDLDHSILSPVLNNSFNRMTFIGHNFDERITIDYNLNFSKIKDGSYSLPYLAIAEVKRDGSGKNSKIAGILRDLSIRPAGFSKYCVGSALLDEKLKSNTLKPKLLLLKKIENESYKFYSS